MLVNLDKDGIINIYPENETEQFALRHWAKENDVTPDGNGKGCEYKVSGLLIHARIKVRNS